jgi:molybdopterin converting factor small subunit
MRILFFANARDAAGCSSTEITGSTPLTIEELWKRLLEIQPSLAPWRPICRIARNGSYLGEGEMLNPDDEVALLPPVSGG